MDPRLDLVRHYRWLRQYGLNDSHSGNLSVRCDTDYWITPTGACADTLQPDALIRCPITQAPPTGASLDAALHRQVYLKNPQTRVVMHSHGPHSIAMTLNGGDFIPVDFEGGYYFERIPVLDIPFGEYKAQSPDAVASALCEHPVVVVRGHGVYTGAASFDLAYKYTCSFEASARIAWLAARRP